MKFHYSKLENIDPKTHYAYEVLRGVGVDNKRDGDINPQFTGHLFTS